MRATLKIFHFNTLLIKIFCVLLLISHINTSDHDPSLFKCNKTAIPNSNGQKSCERNKIIIITTILVFVVVGFIIMIIMLCKNKDYKKKYAEVGDNAVMSIETANENKSIEKKETQRDNEKDIFVSNCEICYLKTAIFKFHNKCSLIICDLCKEKCLKHSKLCPQCRLE